MEQTNENLYSPLLQLPQFVAWKKEYRDGKPTKVPYDPKTGLKASVDNPATWSSYTTAAMALMLEVPGNEYDGIGFVLTANDHFCFIDLDKCIIDGRMEPWAQQIVDAFPTYWEFSPSGNGLHGYLIGKIPEKYLTGKKTGRRKGKIEVYDKGRFFTFTENPLENANAICDCQVQLEKLMAKHFTRVVTSNTNIEVSGTLKDIEEIDIPQLLNQLNLSYEQMIEWINSSSNEDKSASNKDLIVVLNVKRHNKNVSDIELMALIRYRRIQAGEGIDKAGRIDYLQSTVNFARSRTPSGEDEFDAVEITDKPNPLMNESADTKWPNPYDIFGDSIITGKPKLEKDMLPQVIADYAYDEAERMGVTPEMIALPCVVVAASVLHDGFKIQPKVHDTEWTESGRLWIGIVADPGCKKTPSINSAIKPLKAMEKKWNTANEQILKIYDARKKEHDKSIRNKDKITLPEPIKPKLKRAIISDATIESLANILSDNPGGILALHDELMGLIGSMDAYKSNKTGKDRAAWLGLYNGGHNSIDRVSKERSIFIQNWSACVLGGIQPDKLISIASTLTDDGLLQRFMIIFGYDSGYEIDRKPNEKAVENYHHLIQALASHEPNEFNSRITLSEGAQKHRQEVYTIVTSVKTLPETTSAMQGHLSKWDGLYARLLIVYHFIECFSAGGELTHVVNEETAERVKNLMLKVLLPNAAKFYNELIGHHYNDTHVKWISGYILSNKITKTTARDIRYVYRALNKKDDRTILSIMQTLETFGWVKVVWPGNGKTPTKYEINPKVHKTFAVKANEEKERRDNIKDKIAQAVKILDKVRINDPIAT